MTAVYIAAAYGRRAEMDTYADELRSLGVRVTSRWLSGEHEAADADPGTLARQFAQDDIADLLAADTLVTFTEPPRSSASRGGRHVEFGIALVSGLRLVVVGHRENVFHHLPQVEFYETWPQAMAAVISRTRSTVPSVAQAGGADVEPAWDAEDGVPA